MQDKQRKRKDKGGAPERTPKEPVELVSSTMFNGDSKNHVNGASKRPHSSLSGSAQATIPKKQKRGKRKSKKNKNKGMDLYGGFDMFAGSSTSQDTKDSKLDTTTTMDIAISTEASSSYSTTMTAHDRTTSASVVSSLPIDTSALANLLNSVSNLVPSPRLSPTKSSPTSSPAPSPSSLHNVLSLLTKSTPSPKLSAKGSSSDSIGKAPANRIQSSANQINEEASEQTSSSSSESTTSARQLDDEFAIDDAIFDPSSSFSLSAPAQDPELNGDNHGETEFEREKRLRREREAEKKNERNYQVKQLSEKIAEKRQKKRLAKLKQKEQQELEKKILQERQARKNQLEREKSQKKLVRVQRERQFWVDFQTALGQVPVFPAYMSEKEQRDLRQGMLQCNICSFYFNHGTGTDNDGFAGHPTSSKHLRRGPRACIPCRRGMLLRRKLVPHKLSNCAACGRECLEPNNPADFPSALQPSSNPSDESAGGLKGDDLKEAINEFTECMKVEWQHCLDVRDDDDGSPLFSTDDDGYLLGRCIECVWKDKKGVRPVEPPSDAGDPDDQTPVGPSPSLISSSPKSNDNTTRSTSPYPSPLGKPPSPHFSQSLNLPIPQSPAPSGSPSPQPSPPYNRLPPPMLYPPVGLNGQALPLPPRAVYLPSPPPHPHMSPPSVSPSHRSSPLTPGGSQARRELHFQFNMNSPMRSMMPSPGSSPVSPRLPYPPISPHTPPGPPPRMSSTHLHQPRQSPNGMNGIPRYPPSPRPIEYALYVSLLAKGTTEADLRDLFGPYGNVLKVDVVDRASEARNDRCFAFVQLDTRQAAQNAIDELHMEHFPPGHTHPIKVAWKTGNGTSRNKGKNSRSK